MEGVDCSVVENLTVQFWLYATGWTKANHSKDKPNPCRLFSNCRSNRLDLVYCCVSKPWDGKHSRRVDCSVWWGGLLELTGQFQYVLLPAESPSLIIFALGSSNCEISDLKRLEFNATIKISEHKSKHQWNWCAFKLCLLKENWTQKQSTHPQSSAHWPP